MIAPHRPEFQRLGPKSPCAFGPSHHPFFPGPEPAICDFFDIDHALQRARLYYRSPACLDLVAKELSVAANKRVDLSAGKLTNVRAHP
jgi:hypothetical protein